MTNEHRNPLAALRALTPERPLTYHEALVIAEHQARRLLTWWDVTEAPVPVEVITEIPHLEVSEHPAMPVHASSHWTGSHWQIVLSSADHPHLWRHSLAHELKHVVDHPHRQYLYSHLPLGLRPAPVERIADHFASTLLMPKNLVVTAYTAGLQDLEGLARHFQVTQQAMAERLRQLGLIPTKHRGRHDQQHRGGA